MARHHTGLLVNLTPKGVVFSFLFFPFLLALKPVVILLQAVAVHLDHAAPTASQAPPLTAAPSVLAATAVLGVPAATLATPLTAGRSLQGCPPLLVHSPRVQRWSRVTLLSRVLF